MCLSGTAPRQGGCLKRGATGRTCRAQCTSRENNCTSYCLDEEAGKIAEEEAVHAVLVKKHDALFADKHEWKPRYAMW